MPTNSKFKINTSDTIKCVTSSQDGRKIAFGNNCGEVSLVDSEGKTIWEKNIGDGIYGIAIMKDGNRVICGGKDCKLRMFNSLGNVEWEFNVGKAIWSLSVDPNGQVIVVGTGDSISMFTEGGSKLWEYDTHRAMVGVGVSRNGSNVVACADEFLYCLDSEGNLSWKKQRSDALWDVDIEKDSLSITIGGWDCTIYSLDLDGNEIWNYKAEGYVRSVRPLDDGGVIAGSHDKKIYKLDNKGELISIFNTDIEISCVCTDLSSDFIYAGAGNTILAFDTNEGVKPSSNDKSGITSEVNSEYQETSLVENQEYEPMFGFGMFDEPSPDTSGILERDDYTNSEASTNPEVYSSVSENYSNAYPRDTQSHVHSNDNVDRGGEYREFAAKVLKGDVKNYLRLGNSAWAEKRLERAAQHFRKATEIEPDEPRAWHNLAVCNYHLALKRNPDDVEGAVESAFVPLEIAKEKGGKEYTSVNKTLAFLASQIGIEED